MRYIKKIFVVIESSLERQPALDRAVFVAQATGASLHLFLCAYDRSIGIATFLSGSQRSTFIETIVDGSRVKVERLAGTINISENSSQIEVSTEAVWNRHPSDAIIEAVSDGDFDLLVKCSRSHLPKGRMFNHVDWNLMRYSPCPVMLVKTGQWDDVGQVLAAVNVAPGNESHATLNRIILEHASYLAAKLKFELHLVCAYPAPPVFVPVSKASNSLQNYRKKMSQMVNKNLKMFGEQYNVLEQHLHAIEGPVDWVIPKVSEDLVAEFVVMGNVSRQSLTGISIGSAAESILDELKTNVLMVRISN